MRTDLSPDTDVSLLPRADLPVIWDAFRAKAELVRATAETLTVTSIDQKEQMALARTTRLTLKEIRIAVENKRVELGESHLKEIKKVNCAANAIKDFISPLEARLLVQENFAEHAEEVRVSTLAISRFGEVKAICPNLPVVTGLGKMSQADYDAYIAGFRAERAAFEETHRLRIEAERRLAEAQAEAQRVAEVTRATIELAQRVALEREKETQAALLAERLRLNQEAKAEQGRQNAIAEAKAQEVYAELKRQNEAEQAVRVIEALRLSNERAVRDADAAEQKRIRDEQFAKLEAELKAERAVKLAEEKRVMELALPPDVLQLWQFAQTLRGIEGPKLTTQGPEALVVGVLTELKSLASEIETSCKSWGLTGK